MLSINVFHIVIIKILTINIFNISIIKVLSRRGQFSPLICHTDFRTGCRGFLLVLWFASPLFYVMVCLPVLQKKTQDLLK